MKPTSLILAITASSLLSACIYINKGSDFNSNWEKAERENKAVISTLQINAEESDIRGRLGEPDFSEGYTDKDTSVRILTVNDPESLEIMRHSAAHVMAQAVMRLHQDAKLTIGPVVDDGFYYDIDMPPVSEEDFPKIEAEMKKIVSETGRK